MRHDTANNWRRVNPRLLEGEPALEIDTGRIKIGNGISRWNKLKYFDKKNNEMINFLLHKAIADWMAEYYDTEYYKSKLQRG